MDEKEMVYERFIKAVISWVSLNYYIIYNESKDDVATQTSLIELECRLSVMMEYISILKDVFGYDNSELYQKMGEICEGHKYDYKND